MVRPRFTGSSTWWRRILVVWPVTSIAGATTVAACSAQSCLSTVPISPSVNEPLPPNHLKAGEPENSTTRVECQNGPFIFNDSFKRVGVYATAFFPSAPGRTLWNNRLNFPNWKDLLRPKSSPETDLIASYVKRNVLERKDDLLLESETLHGWRHPTIDYDHLIAKWTSHLVHLQANSCVKSSFGNRLTMLMGDQTLPYLLQSIKNATRRIWIETYIFDGSPVGEKFILALAEAAKRKVDVLLIVDWLGGFDMPTEWVNLLRKAGVTVSIFHNWRHPAFRDHRKLAVIDEAAFCGSANIGEDGASEAFGGNGRFFDVHVKVEGPAVEHLGQLILESWRETGPLCGAFSDAAQKRQPPQPSPIPRAANGDVFVQVLESNAKRRHRAIQSAYNRVIANASVSISTTAGYFVPPFLLRRSLKTAINQGVPVNLILSGNSDVWGDVYAATFSAAKLKAIGGSDSNRIRVWFSQDQHCHAKTLLVDGLWSSVGSFNFDRHSGRRNLEAVVSCFDARFAKQLEAVHLALTMKQKEPGVRMTTPDTPGLLKDLMISKPLDSTQHFPKTLEMGADDWNRLPYVLKGLMRLAFWFMHLSASPLFDHFDDIDEEAQFQKRQMKWRGWKARSELFFSFGPSSSTLELFAGAGV